MRPKGKLKRDWFFTGCKKSGCAVFRVRVNNRKAQIVRRFPKKEASVMNRRSGSQEGTRAAQTLHRNSGDNGERVPPVPIPNTEVKPFSADGTWLETARESRSLPDPKKKRSHECGVFSFCHR